MKFEEVELDKGVFMVSIDLELAWGFNQELLRGSRTAEKYLRIIKERSRKNVKKLLELSEKFKVPFTWGIVGHLFLSSCDRGENDLSHPDMPRPDLDMSRDWYSNDPCSNVYKEPLWYGTDIIKQILESKVDHEIACHTFSHVDFSKCSKEVALAEIRKCKDVMKDYGITPKSFIFPKNKVGYLSVLKQEGFKIFRFKVDRLSNFLVGIPLETVFPLTGMHINANGLLGIPSSLLFQSPRPIKSLGLLIAFCRGLNKAASENHIFHVTMHDYLETDHLIMLLSKALRCAAKLRDKGRLTIETMHEYYLRNKG